MKITLCIILLLLSPNLLAYGDGGSMNMFEFIIIIIVNIVFFGFMYMAYKNDSL